MLDTRVSDPDRTDDLSLHMPRNAPGHGLARQTTLQWPAPPYYQFVDVAPRDGEPCLLTFTDGEKATGVVVGFNPEEHALKFHPYKAASAVTVACSALLSVRLLRPVLARRERVSLEGPVFPPSERQPFWLKLANNSLLEGETVGHVNAVCGLFLYLPEADNKVLRVLVPAHAAREVRVGKPIGELLIDEKAASLDAVTQALEKQKGLRARRLGEYLTANEIVSQEQLLAALKEQKSQPMQKLGQTLVELGFLTAQELDEALAIGARDRSLQLGQILADMGVVDMDLVHSVMAKKLGIPYVNLRKVRPTPEALKRIPPAVASRYRVLPLAHTESGLVIAIDDPTRTSTTPTRRSTWRSMSNS